MIEAIAIPKDITDAEILALIAVMNPDVRIAKQAPGLTISGYDDDPRELSEIPAVQALCKRLVESGFISIIETGLPEPKMPLAFGAFHIWKISRGEVRRRISWYDKNEIDEFVSVLGECNAKCDAIAK